MTMKFKLKNEDQLLKLCASADLAQGPLSVQTPDSTVILDARSALSLFPYMRQELCLVAGDNVSYDNFMKVVNAAELTL